MGNLIDLNSQIPDNKIPAGIARDTETTAAVNAHINSSDPHPGYLTQSEGDARYRQSAIALVDGDIPAGIARDAETTAAVNAHINSSDPHPGYLTQAEGDARYQRANQVICSLISGTVAAVGVESVVAIPATISVAKIVQIICQISDNSSPVSGTYFMIQGGGAHFSSPVPRVVSGNIRIPGVQASQLVGRPLHCLVWYAP